MAANVLIELASREHAEELAPRLHPEDVAVALADGKEPLEAIRESIEVSSMAWTLRIDGQVAAIFGAVHKGGHPHLNAANAAVSWALTSTLTEKHPREFLRASRQAIGMMLTDFDYLFSLVDARSTKALRWLGHLGYEVRDAVPFGKDSRLFHPLIMRRHHVQWLGR